tara:strand:- start:1020 stop:1193 length:174 start_codon:yes stop_codon:yes gene_type:complete
MEYEYPVEVPLYLVISFIIGIVWSMFEMWYVRKDGKKNPKKYIKEEEPRVKSFFDVI